MFFKTDDGGAFPSPQGDGYGLSKRDYFAGQAMIGILANEKLMDEFMLGSAERGENRWWGLAVASRAMADQLIHELKEK